MTDLISTYVDEGRFTDLFVEGLGWDRPRGRPRTLAVTTDSGTLTVEEVATYRGITVWECGQIPDGRGQRLVDREARNASDERLVIFYDGHRQEWRWPQAKDTQGMGASRLVLHEHTVGRPNPALAQRLAQIEIGLDEEGVSVVEVGRRLRRAFDAEKVTNRFYKAFKLQHEALCDAITGLEDGGEDAMTSEVRWYASLLLNRIMFIYFMQKKGFLDDDVDYLRNRLIRIRGMQRSGSPESFYDFYKHFLLPLFHHGLGHPERAKAIDDSNIADLIGDIPYVNGGIFSVHPLEEANDIAVPDSSFESLFDFLDGWQWHLDDRLTGDPNEINPDVLGYIFEQFINNKQQGAYYTQEDVTGYMTENTVLPVFLDRLSLRTGVNPWFHVSRDAHRYIWASLQHGADAPLPARIVDEAATWPRPSWEAPVPDSMALPGESWWEVASRREYVGQLEQRLGHVNSSSDAVDCNIDLPTLVLDVIDSLDNPEDVFSAWETLSSLRIIDPTCGSGAFLFAAMNLLHSLYAALLEAAMHQARTSENADIADLVQAATSHGTVDYFILKHTALQNIYGVDLMPEAVEISRLRLFLKLMSHVQRREDVEPLPDLEFNIRTGNVLVGAVRSRDVVSTADVLHSRLVEDVELKAAEAASVYRRFAAAQTSKSAAEVEEIRRQLHTVTSDAIGRLDEWWQSVYGEHGRQDSEGTYLQSHRPFHWSLEFPDVFDGNGGFDVVVGNPPYVRKASVTYHYEGFVTDGCPDIYAPCTERAASILCEGGMMAFIVPHSLMFSGDFAALRSVLAQRLPKRWTASFARIPASLFGSEVRVRNTIVIGQSQGVSDLVTSRCRRWVADYRPHLFQTIQYARPATRVGERWPMVDDPLVVSAFAEIEALGLGTLTGLASNRQHKQFQYPMHFKTNAYAYISAFIDVPPVRNADGSEGVQTEMGTMWFTSIEDRDIAYAFSISRLMFAWWRMWGDDYHVTKEVLGSLIVGPHNLPESVRTLILASVPHLRALQTMNPTVKKNAGKEIGNWDLSAVRSQLDEHEYRWMSELRLGHVWPAIVGACSADLPRTM